MDIPVRVIEVTGPLSYKVVTDDGRVWRRHIDQLRRDQSSSPQEVSASGRGISMTDDCEYWPLISTGSDSSPDNLSDNIPSGSTIPPVGQTPRGATPVAPRRSSRTRQPVDRYAPMVST